MQLVIKREKITIEMKLMKKLKQKNKAARLLKHLILILVKLEIKISKKFKT